MKDKLVFYTKYNRDGPSSRYRVFQYIPLLRNEGIDCEVRPLLGSYYLKRTRCGLPFTILRLLHDWIRRIIQIILTPRKSIVFIEYELLPYAPPILEMWLKFRKCSIICDYDDAVFHHYDQNKSKAIRLLFKNKISTVMRLSDLVIAGNSYLSTYAVSAGAKKVYIIPTVVDIKKYKYQKSKSNDYPQVIGWIGSKTTAAYLGGIAEPLLEVCSKRNVRIRLIGSGELKFPCDFPTEIIDWSEDDEAPQISRFTIGIMPLPETLWAKGKCGLKIIQYMASGLPVIASPVGVNSDIVDHGVNGFLAKTKDQWVQYMQILLDDPDMCSRFGAAGRHKVIERYSIDKTFPLFLSAINSLR